MKQIILCQGLPASGKTTWAKNYCIENSFTKRINKDDIRTEFGNPKWSQEFEDTVLEKERSIGLDIVEKGFSLIVDDTNFSEKHINYWKNVAKKNNYEFILKTFNTPLLECIKRDSMREKPVGEAVIKGMYNKYIKNANRVDDRFMLEQNRLLAKCIICDLDGTLALINGRKPFDTNVLSDKVNFQVRRLLEHFNNFGFEIIYISGRVESAKQNTIEWLQTNGCWFRDLNQKLYTRKNNDFRPDEIIKKEIYEEFIKDKYFVEAVLDDRDKVVEMWRDLGLLCLQVYYGNF